MLLVDYAWGHPRPPAIKAAGYGGALRYLSHDPGKNLTRAEADLLRSAALDIGVVWESTANRVLYGLPAGWSDGIEAKRQAEASGAPQNAAIYFAVDFDIQRPQLPLLSDYANTFAKAISPHPVGIYGGLLAVQQGANLGIRYRWQTAAWSGGERADGICLFQRVAQTYIDGVQCDINEQLADFGGWLSAPLPPPEEARVQLNQPIVGPPIYTNTGNGYWLVAADGGIFPFGDAVAAGLERNNPVPGVKLNAPITGAAKTQSGNGLLLVAADGGIFPLGDAVDLGSIPAL